MPELGFRGSAAGEGWGCGERPTVRLPPSRVVVKDAVRVRVLGFRRWMLLWPAAIDERS